MPLNPKPETLNDRCERVFCFRSDLSRIEGPMGPCGGPDVAEFGTLNPKT